MWAVLQLSLRGWLALASRTHLGQFRGCKQPVRAHLTPVARDTIVDVIVRNVDKEGLTTVLEKVPWSFTGLSTRLKLRPFFWIKDGRGRNVKVSIDADWALFLEISLDPAGRPTVLLAATTPPPSPPDKGASQRDQVPGSTDEVLAWSPGPVLPRSTKPPFVERPVERDLRAVWTQPVFEEHISVLYQMPGAGKTTLFRLASQRGRHPALRIKVPDIPPWAELADYVRRKAGPGPLTYTAAKRTIIRIVQPLLVGLLWELYCFASRPDAEFPYACTTDFEQLVRAGQEHPIDATKSAFLRLCTEKAYGRPLVCFDDTQNWASRNPEHHTEAFRRKADSEPSNNWVEFALLPGFSEALRILPCAAVLIGTTSLSVSGLRLGSSAKTQPIVIPPWSMNEAEQFFKGRFEFSEGAYELFLPIVRDFGQNSRLLDLFSSQLSRKLPTTSQRLPGLILECARAAYNHWSTIVAISTNVKAYAEVVHHLLLRPVVVHDEHEWCVFPGPDQLPESVANLAAEGVLEVSRDAVDTHVRLPRGAYLEFLFDQAGGGLRLRSVEATRAFLNAAGMVHANKGWAFQALLALQLSLPPERHQQHNTLVACIADRLGLAAQVQASCPTSFTNGFSMVDNFAQIQPNDFRVFSLRDGFTRSAGGDNHTDICFRLRCGASAIWIIVQAKCGYQPAALWRLAHRFVSAHIECSEPLYRVFVSSEAFVNYEPVRRSATNGLNAFDSRLAVLAAQERTVLIDGTDLAAFAPNLAQFHQLAKDLPSNPGAFNDVPLPTAPSGSFGTYTGGTPLADRSRRDRE